MKNSEKKTLGFTLMEIVITIVILGIVAGLAVPVYTSTIERSRENEALANLGVIHMAEKIYFINNGSFWGPGNQTLAQVNTALSTDMDQKYYTTFTITANGAVSYTARLTRNGVEGGNGTKWFQNDYTRATNTLTSSNGG